MMGWISCHEARARWSEGMDDGYHGIMLMGGGKCVEWKVERINLAPLFL